MKAQLGSGWVEWERERGRERGGGVSVVSEAVRLDYTGPVKSSVLRADERGHWYTQNELKTRHWGRERGNIWSGKVLIVYEETEQMIQLLKMLSYLNDFKFSSASSAEQYDSTVCTFGDRNVSKCGWDYAVPFITAKELKWWSPCNIMSTIQFHIKINTVWENK